MAIMQSFNWPTTYAVQTTIIAAEEHASVLSYRFIFKCETKMWIIRRMLMIIIARLVRGRLCCNKKTTAQRLHRGCNAAGKKERDVMLWNVTVDYQFIVIKCVCLLVIIRARKSLQISCSIAIVLPSSFSCLTFNFPHLLHKKQPNKRKRECCKLIPTKCRCRPFCRVSDCLTFSAETKCIYK